MSESEEITVADAFNRFSHPIDRQRAKRETIVCFDCKKRISKIKLTDNGKHGVCPNCGHVLFDWDVVTASTKFFALKRAFLAHKRGHYTTTNLLYFIAGFCGYVPTSKDVEVY